MNALEVIAVSLSLLVFIALVHLVIKLVAWIYPPSKCEPSPPFHHVTVGSVNSPTAEVIELEQEQKWTSTEESKALGRHGSRYTYERFAKGNVKIMNCDPLGRFITIQNTARLHPIDIGNWQLCRKIDESMEIVFIFPEGHALRALGICKVYTSDNEKDMSNNDLLFQRRSWGSGNRIETSLIRPDGITMAVFSETTESSASAATPTDSDDA